MNHWKKENIESMVERTLKFATADSTTVTVDGFSEGATRFSGSEITQNVVSDDLEIFVNSAFGKSKGSASTNMLTDDALLACVKRAEGIARLTKPDPEFMPPVKPTALPEADTWSGSTAKFSPLDRAQVVMRVVKETDARKLEAAGAVKNRARLQAVCNSEGHFAYNTRTGITLQCSISAGESIGYAKGWAKDARQLDVESLTIRASDKAVAGQSPKEIEPDKYDVILEPAAVGNLLGSFFYRQMMAKRVDEGQTYFSDKRDAEIAGDNIHLYSDPLLPECPSCPFNWEGAGLGKVNWIKDKKIANLAYSRYWAAHKGKRFTGFPRLLALKGGNSSVEEMVKSTKRGLLVTRIWYIRSVDPMQDLYTGTTRDGTFYIENGEIAYPVKNLRFNDSFVRVLSNIEALGKQVNTPGWPLTRVPPLKVKNFNFTSATRF